MKSVKTWSILPNTKTSLAIFTQITSHSLNTIHLQLVHTVLTSGFLCNKVSGAKWSSANHTQSLWSRDQSDRCMARSYPAPCSLSRQLSDFRTS